MIVILLASVAIFAQGAMGSIDNQPRLGRTVHLGDFYNAKTDQVMAGISLWDQEKIEKEKIVQHSQHTKIDAIIEQDFEDKTSLFDLDAEVSMSFLAGLIKVGGSAKYLLDEKKSNNKLRVVGYATNVNRTETIPLGLMKSQVQYNHLCTDFPDATHVISSVTYGLQAVFSFEKEEADSKKRQLLEGSLRAAFTDTGVFSINGGIEGTFNEGETSFTQNVKTTFYGDFTPKKTPATFDEAKLFLYTEIGEYLQNPTITRFSLQPIAYYCDRIHAALHQINKQRLTSMTLILKQFRDMKRKISTLLQHSVAQRFRSINLPLHNVETAVKKMESEVHSSLKELLPKIRGNATYENKLTELQDKYLNSPIKFDKTNAFLNRREREINTLFPWIQLSKTEPKIHIDEEKFATDNKCLIFNQFNLVLEAHVLPMANSADLFLKGEEIETNQQWFNNAAFLGNGGRILRDFVDLAKANNHREDICFIFKLKHQMNNILPAIFIAEYGNFSNFTPHTKPEIESVRSCCGAEGNNVLVKLQPNDGANIKHVLIKLINDIDNTEVVDVTEASSRTSVTFPRVPLGSYTVKVYFVSEIGDIWSKPAETKLVIRNECAWNNWETWSSCSKTCGGGRHTRTRTILKEEETGALVCSGSNFDSGSCKTQHCPETTRATTGQEMTSPTTARTTHSPSDSTNPTTASTTAPALDIAVIGGRDKCCTSYARDVEIFNANSNKTDTSSCGISKYPIPIAGANGVITLQGIIMCGGAYPRTNSCYKYKDSTLGWVNFPAMNHGRHSHGMTSIGEHIFAAGGWDNDNGSGYKDPDHRSAEVYKKGKWTKIANLPQGLRNHCLVTLDQNRIMAIGGVDYSGRPTSKTYIFHTYSNQWTEGKSMNVEREGLACTSINNISGNVNKILVAGGDTRGAEKTTEIYNVVEGIWNYGPNLTVPVKRSSLVPAPTSSNFSAYLVSGSSSTVPGAWGITNRIQAISKTLDSWFHVGNLTIGRMSHTALAIPPELIEGCTT